MDPLAFQARVLRNVCQSPLVVVPFGLGAATFGVAVAIGSPVGFLGFLGLSGVLAGVGIAATRWVFGFDELTRTAFDELQDESNRHQTLSLDRLAGELQTDHDGRTTDCVNELRKLYQLLKSAGMVDDPVESPILPEIKSKAQQLYESCLKTLASTLELWRKAQKMATAEGRQQVLKLREDRIAEVRKSLANLGKALDYLQMSELKRDRQEDNLIRMREELDRGLQVSQRVEQRMKQLDKLAQEPASKTPPDQ